MFGNTEIGMFLTFEIHTIFEYLNILSYFFYSGVEQRFQKDEFATLISPVHIEELRKTELSENGLYIGAGFSLSEMMHLIEDAIKITKGVPCPQHYLLRFM